jgi:hypothetical protein
MAQDSKDFAYVLNIATRKGFAVGDYVALIDDRLNQSTSSTLGKFSDHRVGEVTKVLSNQCVEVRYGSATSIGIYDQKCLGYVSVTLKEGSSAPGSLGSPAEQKVGSIKAWSTYGMGDTVLIKVNDSDPPSKYTTYKVSDLNFHITTVPPIYGTKMDQSRMMGGSSAKRKTIRRSRTKNFFTRFFRRV